MLYPGFAKQVYATKAKMNPLLASGYSRHLASPRNIIQYLHRALSGYNKDFPKGIRYSNIEICSAKETIARITRKSYQKHTLNIHDSDLFMVKANFTFDGRKKPIYLYLPLIGQGGTFKINGTLYLVCPIPADTGISVDTTKNIREPSFRVSKAPIKFPRNMHGIYKNDKLIHTSLIYSFLFNKNAKARELTQEQLEMPIVDCLPLLAAYIFCEYGFDGAVERYCGTTPKVISLDASFKLTEEELETYDVYRSSGIIPKGVRNKNNWKIPKFAVLVKRSDSTDLIHHLVGSFFYIIEHYPERFRLEDFHTKDEVNLWVMTLGKALWKNAITEGRILNETDAHLSSVRTYLDVISKMTLEEADVYCNDIYDLFIHVMVHEKEYYITKNVADIGQKKLMILPNLLRGIMKGFNNAYYRLEKRNRTLEMKGESLVDKDFDNAFNMVQYDAFLEVNKKEHPEVITVSTPNDSIVTNLSLLCMPLSRANSAKSTENSNIEISQLFHPSVLEFGCINNITDKDLSGRDRLNLYCLIDKNGHFVHNPELDEVMSVVSETIYG